MKLIYFHKDIINIIIYRDFELNIRTNFLRPISFKENNNFAFEIDRSSENLIIFFL